MNNDRSLLLILNLNGKLGSLNAAQIGEIIDRAQDCRRPKTFIIPYSYDAQGSRYAKEFVEQHQGIPQIAGFITLRVEGYDDLEQIEQIRQGKVMLNGDLRIGDLRFWQKRDKKFMSAYNTRMPAAVVTDAGTEHTVEHDLECIRSVLGLYKTPIVFGLTPDILNRNFPEVSVGIRKAIEASLT